MLGSNPSASSKSRTYIAIQASGRLGKELPYALGGIWQCMVLAFVALAIHRFDISLAGPQILPKYQEDRARWES